MANNDRLITIDVGGRVFRTHLSTLVKSTYFQAQFSGNFGDCEASPQNPLFVDRDPDSFTDILRYMRTELVPQYLGARTSEVHAEALFFGLDDLAAALAAPRVQTASFELRQECWLLPDAETRRPVRAFDDIWVPRGQEAPKHELGEHDGDNETDAPKWVIHTDAANLSDVIGYEFAEDFAPANLSQRGLDHLRYFKGASSHFVFLQDEGVTTANELLSAAQQLGFEIVSSDLAFRQLATETDTPSIDSEIEHEHPTCGESSSRVLCLRVDRYVVSRKYWAVPSVSDSHVEEASEDDDAHCATIESSSKRARR